MQNPGWVRQTTWENSPGCARCLQFEAARRSVARVAECGGLASVSDFDRIPVLDLTGARGGGKAAFVDEVAALSDNLETSGFLYLSGHGVPEESVRGDRAGASMRCRSKK